MNRVLQLAATFAAWSLAACAAFAQPSQTFTPGPFTRIFVSGVANVQLTQGEQDQVTVLGDSGRVRSLEISVNKGRLVLATHEDWTFWRREPVNVKVQVRQLEQLQISGAGEIVATGPLKVDELRVGIAGKGDVRLPDLAARTLRFDIAGAGDATLAGKVDDLKLAVSGKGSMAADKLRASKASVSISGVGNADLWVVDDLKVSVSGVGSVSYWGTPKLSQSGGPMSNVTARGEKK